MSWVEPQQVLYTWAPGCKGRDNDWTPQTLPPGLRNVPESVDHAHYQDDDESRNRLHSVRELPQEIQQIFHKFRFFNPVQSECFNAVYNSDINMVVAAPTGSGKTGILELAMARLISKDLASNNGGVSARLRGSSKAVYVAPMRALIQEKLKDWSERFGKLGLTILELSGDHDPSSEELSNADIICTTPEKFDSITRKMNESGGAKFYCDISLVLIDEVHLLNEQERGSALEAGVVSRIRMVGSQPDMKRMPISKVRFVAVSATIPNIQDIAEWLEVPEEGLRVYGEEMRPVKLATHVRSYAPSKNDFLFELRLNDYISGIISEHSKGKPTLVFCSSRKGTTDTAARLVKDATDSAHNKLRSCYIRDQAHADRLRQASQKTKNKPLSLAIASGVGFHNASLEVADRQLVEDLFINRDLPVLTTTSTLALGVNLPAYLVVIKGTRRYCGKEEIQVSGSGGSGYKEYDRSVCLQMVGRAGRPQYDTEGLAVIMTQKQTASRYYNLLSGAEDVESCLKDSFAEHMNSEIVLQTIRDVSQALNWLKTTFMYQRIKRRPENYGMPRLSKSAPARAPTQQEVEAYMRDKLVLDTVRLLSQHGMVISDGFLLKPGEPGKLMSHHYISLNTMVEICSAPRSCGMPGLLRILAKAQEFSSVTLRRTEKKILNEINKRSDEPLKYFLPDPSNASRPKQRIMSSAEKVYILVGEALSDSGGDSLEFSMKQEMEQIIRVGQRIASCMSRYFAYKKELAATGNSLKLVKSLRQRMWEDSRQLSRQLPNIGHLLAKRLADHGLDTLKALDQVDARRIELVTQRHYPFGTTVKQELKKKMPPDLQVSISAVRQTGRRGLDCSIVLTRKESDTTNSSTRTHAKLIAGSVHDDNLLLCKDLIVETFPSPFTFQVSVSLPTTKNVEVQIIASVILDQLVGVDTISSLHLPVDGQLSMQSFTQKVDKGSRPEGSSSPQGALQARQNSTQPTPIRQHDLESGTVGVKVEADSEFTGIQGTGWKPGEKGMPIRFQHQLQSHEEKIDRSCHTQKLLQMNRPSVPSNVGHPLCSRDVNSLGCTHLPKEGGVETSQPRSLASDAVRRFQAVAANIPYYGSGGTRTTCTHALGTATEPHTKTSATKDDLEAFMLDVTKSPDNGLNYENPPCHRFEVEYGKQEQKMNASIEEIDRRSFLIDESKSADQPETLVLESDAPRSQQNSLNISGLSVPALTFRKHPASRPVCADGSNHADDTASNHDEVDKYLTSACKARKVSLCKRDALGFEELQFLQHKQAKIYSSIGKDCSINSQLMAPSSCRKSSSSNNLLVYDKTPELVSPSVKNSCNPESSKSGPSRLLQTSNLPPASCDEHYSKIQSKRPVLMPKLPPQIELSTSNDHHSTFVSQHSNRSVAWGSFLGDYDQSDQVQHGPAVGTSKWGSKQRAGTFHGGLMTFQCPGASDRSQHKAANDLHHHVHHHQAGIQGLLTTTKENEEERVCPTDQQSNRQFPQDKKQPSENSTYSGEQRAHFVSHSCSVKSPPRQTGPWESTIQNVDRLSARHIEPAEQRQVPAPAHLYDDEHGMPDVAHMSVFSFL